MAVLTPTQEKIHKVAMQHFLKEGFQGASLRRIVSEAGFTLGAFYGYYDSKEQLFEALVGETAEGIVSVISAMGDEADSIPPEQRPSQMMSVFTHGMPGLVDYVLAHPDETRLLLKCSAGTRYQNFLDNLMVRDLNFVKVASNGDFPLHPLAADLLVHSYFSLFGDAVLSGGTREEIMQAMEEIHAMFTGGMLHLWKGESK